MAKKDKVETTTDQATHAELFSVNVGESKTIGPFTSLGVPSGYVIWHGSTAVFIPAVEETQEGQ